MEGMGMGHHDPSPKSHPPGTSCDQVGPRCPQIAAVAAQGGLWDPPPHFSRGGSGCDPVRVARWRGGPAVAGSPAVQAAAVRGPRGSRAGVAFWASGQSGASRGSCPRCRRGRGDPAARAPCGHISLATTAAVPESHAGSRGHRASHAGDNSGQGVPGRGAIWGGGRGGCSFQQPPLWMLDPGDPEFNPTYGAGTRCPRRRWLVTAQMSPSAGSGEALAAARRGGGRSATPPCHGALAPSPPRSGPRVPRGAVALVAPRQP